MNCEMKTGDLFSGGNFQKKERGKPPFLTASLRG
jgi:hypothetical protein